MYIYNLNNLGLSHLTFYLILQPAVIIIVFVLNTETIEKTSQIALTPLASRSRYRVTWMPSFYHTSRYMMTVHPPESYKPENLIIHNTDNRTVHNITIALNDSPHRIYSTFTLSKYYYFVHMFVIEIWDLGTAHTPISL